MQKTQVIHKAQKSEQYSRINLYISGFGPFLIYKETPSKDIVDKIVSEQAQFEKLFDKKVRLCYFHIYECTKDYIDENLLDLYNLVHKNNTKNNVLHLIIHFGVHTGTEAVEFEKKSKNFYDDKIDSKGEIFEGQEEKIYCKLDLKTLFKPLKDKYNKKVNYSRYAGNYVCNYIYHVSLDKFKYKQNIAPIFVHVPFTREMSTDTAYQIFVDFIQEVIKYYIK